MTEEEKVSLRTHLEQKIEEVDRKITEWIRLWREERQRGLTEINTRSEALEARLLERLDGQSKAIEKAENALNQRLAGMNEFRETLRDQAARLASREQVDLLKEALERRLREMENWSANVQGRIAVIAGIWGFIIVVLSVMLNYAIRRAFE